MATLDQVELGERLRIARTTAGQTQEESAQALGLARTTMVAIERGERPLRAQELMTLARLYGTSVNALLRKEAVHVDLVAQFRRPLGRHVEAGEEVDAIRLLHQLAASSAELEQRLGKARRQEYPPETPIARAHVEQQAEDLASELRQRLGLGLGPIPDMFALCELEIGMRIFVRSIASEIAGVFAFHPALGACVLVNAKHPRARQTWTLAHEVGHLLTNRSATDVCASAGRKVPTERFADLFAAAFLMPGPTMRKRFAEVVEADSKFSARHLVLLSRRYYVSVEAMSRRLEHLELLPPGTYDRLKRAGTTRQLVSQILGEEPVAEQPPRLLRLPLLAAEAHAEGLLSEEQVANMLALDLIEVRQLLDDLDETGENLLGAQ